MSKTSLKRSQAASVPPQILMGASSGYLDDIIEVPDWNQDYHPVTKPYLGSQLALQMLNSGTVRLGTQVGTTEIFGGGGTTQIVGPGGASQIIGGAGTYPSSGLRVGTTIEALAGTDSNTFSYIQGSSALGGHIMALAALSVVPFRYVAIGELFPKSLRQWTNEFDAAIRQEPVQDGLNHPGQSALEGAFISDPEGAARWTLAKLKDENHPSVAADVLRLLLRFKPHTEKWRQELITLGLASKSAEIRDASIQVVENWDEPSLIALLKAHKESEDWLREYLEQVLLDLEA